MMHGASITDPSAITSPTRIGDSAFTIRSACHGHAPKRTSPTASGARSWENWKEKELMPARKAFRHGTMAMLDWSGRSGA